MANRDFDCILCNRHYTRMTADVFLLAETICDECLAELGQLDGDDLEKGVTEKLAGRVPRDKEREKVIISTIQRYRKEMLKGDAGE